MGYSPTVSDDLGTNFASDPVGTLASLDSEKRVPRKSLCLAIVCFGSSSRQRLKTIDQSEQITLREWMGFASINQQSVPRHVPLPLPRDPLRAGRNTRGLTGL